MGRFFFFSCNFLCHFSRRQGRREISIEQIYVRGRTGGSPLTCRQQSAGGPLSNTTQDRPWAKDNETKKRPVHICRGIILQWRKISRQSRESDRDLLISKKRRYHWAKGPDFVDEKGKIN